MTTSQVLYHTGNEVKLLDGQIQLSLEDFLRRWEAKCKEWEIPEEQWHDLPEDQAGRIVQAIAREIVEEIKEKQPEKKDVIKDEWWKWIIGLLALDKIAEWVASDAYSAVKSHTQKTLVNRYFASAKQNRTEGRFEISVTELTKAIEIDPLNVRLYHERGLAYLGWGKSQEAFDDFSKCIQIDPNYYPAYHNRGIALSQIGEYRKAIEEIDKAIGLNPACSECYSTKAYVLLQLGRPREALGEIERSIKANPGNRSAYLVQCWAYVELSDYRQALNACNGFLREESQHPLALVMRGIAYENLGRNYEAIQDLKLAWQIAANPPASLPAGLRQNYEQAMTLAEEHLRRLGVTP